MKCFNNKNFFYKGLSIIVLFTVLFSFYRYYPVYNSDQNYSPESSFLYSVNNFEDSFTNKATHTTSYLWDLSDGTTSSDKDVIYTFSQEGNYTVIRNKTYYKYQ